MKANKPVIDLPIKRFVSSSIAFLVLLVFLFLNNLDIELKIVLFLIAVFFGSYYFSVEALEAIFIKHKISTDVLMLLAYLGAGLLEQFAEATMLIFLYSITETLESVTVKRTRSMIYSLVESMPPTCLKISGKEEIETPIDNLVPDDIIIVKAGGIIPVDGIILKGQAFINESSLTGEFLPVFKTIGSQLFAGTFVTDSVVTIKVSKPVSESTVTKLIKSVEEAQKHKHPLHLMVNRFTRIYNPVIVAVSMLIFMYGIIINDIQAFGIMSASFLVAGAPCALAIGTPVTVIAAIGSAGKNGILVKGGASLERLADVNAFAFDKTGTLTLGQPELSEVISFGKSKNEIFSIIAGLEYSSNHPYAKSIREISFKRNITSLEMDQLKVIPGYGIEGKYNNKIFYIGSFYNDYNVQDQSVDADIQKYRNQGFTLSFVFEERKLIGILLFKDTIREQTIEIIRNLHLKNYQTFILTGDTEKTAKMIGKILNISEKSIFSDLKPGDKLKKILELKNTFTLAMIGDGINDAPALAASDLGIAMGIIGSDIAINTADILIMSENLNVLQKGIQIATKMKSVLKQNIIVSTLIIVGVLFGVVLGFIDLPLAILAHEGSEVIIVGNSLRLLSKKQ